MSDVKIAQVSHLDFSFEPQPWPFADERRVEIDAAFAKMQRDKPALWNGRVLLLHRYALDGDFMRGAFLEADYASFTAWQKLGRPASSIHDCFGAAAIQSADGAFLLGVMGAHTFNAGQSYFPCGTPDPDDISGGKAIWNSACGANCRKRPGSMPANSTPSLAGSLFSMAL